jgi:hypothetical protein
MRQRNARTSPEGTRQGLRRIGAIMASAAALLTLPSAAMARSGSFGGGGGYAVGHDGIYLAQRIGHCLNHTGPCYYGGLCPGGEYSTNLYTNGRVYCDSFYPSAPYPPTLFEKLLGVR